jgi:hypothetical protein
LALSNAKASGFSDRSLAVLCKIEDMKFMTLLQRAFPLFVLVMILTAAVYADVKTEEKGQVTFTGMLGRIAGLFGGNAAKEGVVSTVAVNGERKSRFNEFGGEIIDLSEEKVYSLDVKKKTYTVTTFDELRRQFKEAQAKAEAEAKTARSDAKPASSTNQLDVDFDVKDSGQKKVINGFDTHQVVATVTVREKGKTLEDFGGLVLTSDMWLTPTITALKEISDFDRRYYGKIAGALTGDAQQMTAAMTMYPFLKDAMARLEEEKGKADGTAVMTTLTVESVKGKVQRSQQSTDQASTPNVGGLLGGLGRRVARGNEDQNQEARSTFMKSTHEVLKVVTDVTPADLAIPAGFTEK